jgi:SAM-dependent methyltransferase
MRTESDIVAAQYKAWAYPQPLADIAEAVANGYFDLSDPTLFRRKLWPRRVEPANLDILVAGCGTNQAACLAFANPQSRVVGIDISDTSLGHQKYLKERHDLRNLELFHLSLGQVASLNSSYDLIICTGVLHHLPDPDAGLRCLRDVLRPHGVMSLMVYGYYLRFGVYMLQEVFRSLGLEQDSSAIETIKHTLNTVPKWHHVRSYTNIAPDLGYDSGLIDTFLHRQDRAYTVPQVLGFASQNGLKFLTWLDNVSYSISAYIPRPQDPLRKQVESLPAPDQWRLVELISQRLGTHRFLLGHPDRPESDYVLDFTGSAWLDYVPSLRPPVNISLDQRFRSKSSQEEPSATTVRFKRDWHQFELSRFEAMLLALVDGEHSIRHILSSDALSGWNDASRAELAQRFFRRMADWDHLQYEIPLTFGWEASSRLLKPARRPEARKGAVPFRSRPLRRRGDVVACSGICATRQVDACDSQLCRR